MLRKVVVGRHNSGTGDFKHRLAAATFHPIRPALLRRQQLIYRILQLRDRVYTGPTRSDSAGTRRVRIPKQLVCNKRSPSRRLVEQPSIPVAVLWI